MMREMLARKRQFELRNMNVCLEQKATVLESRVRVGSEHFHNFDPRGKEKTPGKGQSEKIRTSSVRNISDSKQRPAILFDESVYSGSVNTQMVGSPVGTSDAFNKEIMMKLLDIIEKDRLNAIGNQSSVHNREVISKDQKETPIIINNIMKTPVETVNRDLIEREMKIKMLETQRDIKQLRGSASQKKINPPRDSIFIQNKMNEEGEMTDRTRNRPSVGGITTVS